MITPCTRSSHDCGPNQMTINPAESDTPVTSTVNDAIASGNPSSTYSESSPSVAHHLRRAVG